MHVKWHLGQTVLGVNPLKVGSDEISECAVDVAGLWASMDCSLQPNRCCSACTKPVWSLDCFPQKKKLDCFPKKKWTVNPKKSLENESVSENHNSNLNPKSKTHVPQQVHPKHDTILLSFSFLKKDTQKSVSHLIYFEENMLSVLENREAENH